MGRVRVGFGSVATPLEDVVANIHSLVIPGAPGGVAQCSAADAGGGPVEPGTAWPEAWP